MKRRSHGNSRSGPPSPSPLCDFELRAILKNSSSHGIHKSQRSNQHRLKGRPPPLVCWKSYLHPSNIPSERLSKRQGSPRPKKTGELSENRCDGAFSPWSIPKHGPGRINLPASLICSLVTENPMLLSQTTPERYTLSRLPTLTTSTRKAASSMRAMTR